MSTATSTDLDRVFNVGNSQIYIRPAGGTPPRYVVDIKGIDPVSLSHQVAYDNDIHNAVPARTGGIAHDVYAHDIEAAIRANIPPGSEIKLVGHSYGSIAALNMASDPAFNTAAGASSSTGYHVVDVVTTGINAPDMAAKVPAGTNVIMAVDRNDPVATVIHNGNPGTLMSNVLPLLVAPFVPAIGVAVAGSEMFEHGVAHAPDVLRPNGHVTIVSFNGSKTGLEAHDAHVSGQAIDDSSVQRLVPELAASDQRFPVVSGLGDGVTVDLPEHDPGVAESLLPSLPTVGLAVGAILAAPVLPIVGAGLGVGLGVAALGSWVGGLFAGVQHAHNGHSGGTIGADPDDLAHRADALRAVAARLNDIAQRLTQQVHAAPWQGRDAQRFNDDWRRRIAPALYSAEEFIVDKANQLTANASQQRETSQS